MVTFFGFSRSTKRIPHLPEGRKLFNGGRDKKAEEKRLAEENAQAAKRAFHPEEPKRPTALEILKKRRADKMKLIRQLDREIEMLDHDITFIERFPQHGRALEFIAARFVDPSNKEAQPGDWLAWAANE